MSKKKKIKQIWSYSNRRRGGKLERDRVVKALEQLCRKTRKTHEEDPFRLKISDQIALILPFVQKKLSKSELEQLIHWCVVVTSFNVSDKEQNILSAIDAGWREAPVIMADLIPPLILTSDLVVGVEDVKSKEDKRKWEKKIAMDTKIKDLQASLKLLRELSR